MILAEALITRKEYKTRLEDLRSRLQASAVVQEGDAPHESPEELLEALDGLLAEYGQLIARIHRTNLTAKLADGRTITEAIVDRDLLDERMAILRSLAEAGSRKNDRYAYSELRYLTTLDVGALRKEVDRRAKERRTLDIAIQAANWRNDLVS
ncbi:hypothetical protein GCM10008955_24560 [Deinococcus malanensis]|uniref:DIP1984 family protein n=1 Tax=Deinococcus malanensis TaxID=1706855 RepID=A0ABQ2EWI1_9DEIO|nr:DIP1984 family protein [Deinococcus malanensis]GGK29807.1 hypothetical protein GCM10008955_24560 [Deinococcus malanensis]